MCGCKRHSDSNARCVCICPEHEGARRKQAKDDEMVNHPAHYGGDSVYEVIKVLHAWGLHLNAALFNVVKYVARAGKKNGNVIEDLKKARFYLDWEIERLENEHAAQPAQQDS